MSPAEFFEMSFGDWIEHADAMGASDAAIERMCSVQLRLMAASVIARYTLPGSTEQLVIEVFRQLHEVEKSAGQSLPLAPDEAHD